MPNACSGGLVPAVLLPLFHVVAEVPDAAEYVLAPFQTESESAVEEMVRRGRDAVKVICSRGLIPAMNLFNRSI